MNNSTDPPAKKQDTNPPPAPVHLSWRTWLAVLIAMIIVNVLFYSGALGGTRKPVPQATLSYSTFIHQVQAGHIKNATVTGTSVTGAFSQPYHLKGVTYRRFQTTVAAPVTDRATAVMQAHHVNVTFVDQTTPFWEDLLGLLFSSLPFIFLIAVFAFAARQAQRQTQGIFRTGRSSAKVYTEERPKTTFADVAGVDNAKSELQEIVHFLKDPSSYQRLGAHIPKGVLLVGPPGTGKTLLARAVAGEAQVAFLSISATEFIEMFVGVGASRVRDLFDQAKKIAPSIIFVDEIDAIGGSRGGPQGFGNDERDQTLNQLLVSMDGFEPNEAVVVLAATNRPDILDPALLRPGRFDRQVQVDPPDRQGREAILKVHTRDIPLDSSVDLGEIARATPGMSGADLANLANEAALVAARNNESAVTAADFSQALDRITLGLEGSPLMSAEERRTVAYHEAGHALVAYSLPGMDAVSRITITPRGRSLGVTQLLPMDDRRNYRREYLINRMATGLGGRAAEETVLDDISSGAENDLQFVTNIGRMMVTQLGMAEDLGPTYFGGQQDRGLGGRPYQAYEAKQYSEATGQRIDDAVASIIAEAHERAISILSARRADLERVAQALMKDESLDREQFVALLKQPGSQLAEPAQ